MNPAPSPPNRAPILLFAVATALFAAALFARGLAPKKVVLPRDIPVAERPKLRDPMQLLSPAARLRAQELDPLVSPAQATTFTAVRKSLFAYATCPELLDFANSADGQRFEHLLEDLRNGTREDAFASLALILRAARACEWKPGLRAHTEHAEKLGTWLGDWLRTWAEPSAKDPLLSEPALAAGLVYGKIMHTAWKAPIVGHNQAPYDKALALLDELTGTPPSHRTAYGEMLQLRYPRALTQLLLRTDALSGCAEECATLYPDLTGECAR
ncbi:MAG: hypothetical protein HZA53_05210 [Planctomycetes bacterium]|nr:hypothetical protein [Planctomycetota bacterium]